MAASNITARDGALVSLFEPVVESRENTRGRLPAESRVLQDLTDNASTFVGHASETARQYVHQATDCVRGSAHQAANHFCEGVEGAKGLVRDRPGETLAICFGAGLLVGLVCAVKCRFR
jgi:ElaB/YqjD/DUF883 family membrane-anchored ribosome-binding protein